MIVILDTNVLVSDPGFASNAFKVFRSESQRHGMKLLIPELVLIEAVEKHRSKLEEARQKLRKAADAIQVLAVPVDTVALEGEIDRAAGRFESRLRDMIVAMDGRTVDFPDVSHEDVAGRMVRREKPFNHSGEGYRDALIWESIIPVVRGEEPVVLVTANKKDFAQDEEGRLLADDLRADLRRRGIDSDNLNVYPSLKALVDEHLQPSVDARVSLASRLATDSPFRSVVEAGVVERIHHELRVGRSVYLSKDDDLSQRGSNSEIEEVAIAVVHAPPLHDLKIEDGAIIGGETILGVYCEVDVDIDYWGMHHDGDEDSRWGGPHSWAPTLHERQFSGSATRTVGISLEGSLTRAQDGFQGLTIVHVNSGFRLLG